MLDKNTFREVFKPPLIQFMYEKIIDNQTIISIPTHFIANEVVSAHFTENFLLFLIDKME